MPEPTRTNILIDSETQRQINDLALWWGVEQSRNFMIIVRRCIQRVHSYEKAKRELDEFDKAQGNWVDPKS